MITAVFFLVASLIVNLVAGLFNRFPIYLPNGIVAGFQYFFNAFASMQSLFPVADAFIVLGFLLSVYWRVYLFRIIVWGISFLPFVNGSVDLPHTSSPGDRGETVDLRPRVSNPQGRVIDLRKGRIQTKYRTMQDIRKGRR